MKNVCIVGYGAIGPIHAEALRGVKTAKFYAVCDIKPEKIEECRLEYDVIGYTDFDIMLSDPEIDSVHICTPHYLHFQMIKKALAAGKNVVCEKPLTMTKDEFKELLVLRNSDKVCVIMQNRLNPCIRMFKDIIQSGEMGEIKTAKGIMTWQRTQEYYDSDEWRGKWSTEGGGVLINQAVHSLDFFNYLIGDVKELKAQMINFSLEKIEVEDTFSAYITFCSGVNGVFFATNAYGDNTYPLFEVVFEKGIVRYIDSKLYRDGELIEEDALPSVGKSYWGSSHEALLSKYYDEGKYNSPHTIKNTMNTMFAMYESAKHNGRKEEIL